MLREAYVTIKYDDPNHEIIRYLKETYNSDSGLMDDLFNLFDSIGIQDIDESIMYYFQNVIRPFVIQNGTRIEVPIIYGSPEKWKSFQKDGYYRDQKGRIMAPLIMFKRTDITKNRAIANKLDANYPNNFGVFTKQ